MTGHICFGVKKDCWNLIDSFGEICVGCGCCSKDLKKRYESRIRVTEEHLKERENFSLWAYDYPDLLETQKKNVAKDIEDLRRELEMYRQKLKDLMES